MPRITGHLLLLGSMHSLSTGDLRLMHCALLCAPCTMPSVPVCVCLTLCLTCSPIFSASRRHPDPQRQPWLCPSLLSHSLRPRKEDQWLRAELRSRAHGSVLGHTCSIPGTWCETALMCLLCSCQQEAQDVRGVSQTPEELTEGA